MQEFFVPAPQEGTFPREVTKAERDLATQGLGTIVVFAADFEECAALASRGEQPERPIDSAPGAMRGEDPFSLAERSEA